MDLYKDLFFILWFFLPAGLANIAAFLSGKLPIIKRLSYPLDFYIKFRGKRLLGSHKTIRGVISGILGGVIVVGGQIAWYQHSSSIRYLVPIDYAKIDPIILGSLAGFGALAGDAVKSFFKRQKEIAPGKSWFPFDQIDYIIGGIACMSFSIHLDLAQYILLFIVWFLLHPLTTFLGYLLRLNEAPL